MYSEKTIKKTLDDLKKGKISPQKAFKKLKNLPYETLAHARIDHHRQLRHLVPEVIYAPGKSLTMLKCIISSFKKKKQAIVITRLKGTVYKKLKKEFSFLSYSSEGKIGYWKSKKKIKYGSTKSIAVVTAGTSDIPVAEEAAVTCELLGERVYRFYDCGVAGIHRLVDILPHLHDMKTIICVAGMEGALASVIAGLVNVPIIAVPTSVGYGASFQGIAPLLTMMNACAPGIAVVNIDNGFGAACFASMITNNR